MTKSIHQLFCTHCTYGTSALHRNTDRLQQQPFEYSTRAGSISQALAHITFQRIEKQFFRGLPMPGDATLELRKSTAESIRWRRLVYTPSVDGLCMLAHISSRPYDTAGRLGSYFAHVLLAEHSESIPRWDPLDCLKLWGARFWALSESNIVSQSGDGLEKSFDLEMIDDLKRPGFGELINDETLRAFLGKLPVGDAFFPARWHAVPRDRRLQLVIDLLHAVLELDLDRHERLILAVEPQLAALLFYAIFRLLPQIELRTRLSFSTFESHLDRPSTALVAYDFVDPQITDLSSETYRSKGFVVNTYRPLGRLPFRSAASTYSQMIVGVFVEHGGVATNQAIEQITTSGANTPEDIEKLSSLQQRIESYCRGESPWQHIEGDSDCERQFAGRILADFVNQAPRESMRMLAEMPTSLNVLDLISGVAGDRSARQAELRLSRVIPIKKLMSLPRLSPQIKAGRLKGYLEAKGGVFPSGCPEIWQFRGKPSDVLTELLRVSTVELIQSWTVPVEFDWLYAAGLCKNTSDDQSRRPLAVEAVMRLKPEGLADLLNCFRETPSLLIRVLGAGRSRFVARLQELLSTLLVAPSYEVVPRIETLLTAAPHLSELQSVADRWVQVRKTVQRVSQSRSTEDSSIASDAQEILKALTVALSSSQKPLSPLQLPRPLIESIAKAWWGSAQVQRLHLVLSLIPKVQLRITDDLALCEFLTCPTGQEWINKYPPQDDTLTKRIQTILNELHHSFSTLSDRLRGLEAAKRYLLPSDGPRLMDWIELEKSLRRVRVMRSDFHSASEMKGQEVLDLGIALGPKVFKCLRNHLSFDPANDRFQERGALENLSRGVVGDDTLIESKFFFNFILKAFRDATPPKR